MVRVPIEWIDVQHGGPVSGLTGIMDLYRAWGRGGDGADLPHARELGDRWLPPLRKAHAGPLSDDPLPVLLTALGRYELQDGHHRAARRIFEGETTLPVEVVEASPSWTRLEEDLSAIYQRCVLYQGIEHPAFDGWARNRADSRFPLLLAAAGEPRGSHSWLDVGSCTGRVCREARRSGRLAVGIDCDRVVVRVAEYLDAVFGTRCTWHVGSDPLPLLNSGWGWDVVSCLSVFHRPLANGGESTVAPLFRRMAERSRVFLTDAAHPKDRDCLSWDWANHGDWLARVTRKTVRAVGETEGRVIFAVE